MEELRKCQNPRVVKMDKILRAAEGIVETPKPAAAAEKKPVVKNGKGNLTEDNTKDELLRKHGQKIFRILDTFNDDIAAAEAKLEKALKILPEEVRKKFGLTQQELDTFGEKLEDFIDETEFSAGNFEIALMDLDLEKSGILK
jgi:uncharacterized protein YPO0396